MMLQWFPGTFHELNIPCSLHLSIYRSIITISCFNHPRINQIAPPATQHHEFTACRMRIICHDSLYIGFADG